MELKEALIMIWVTIDTSYFTKLADSMPRRLQIVIQFKETLVNTRRSSTSQ